jgi:hypothetical protein
VFVAEHSFSSSPWFIHSSNLNASKIKAKMKEGRSLPFFSAKACSASKNSNFIAANSKNQNIAKPIFAKCFEKCKNV